MEAGKEREAGIRKASHLAGGRKPLLRVLIGGDHSGCGKTSLGVLLLRHFPGSCVIKVAAGVHRSPSPGLHDVTGRQEPPGTDTQRYQQGGARCVFLIGTGSGATQLDLRKAIRKAIRAAEAAVTHGESAGPILPLLLCEGNAAQEFFRPNLIAYVTGKGPAKESARKLRERADLLWSAGSPIEPIVSRIRDALQEQARKKGSKREREEEEIWKTKPF